MGVAVGVLRCGEQVWAQRCEVWAPLQCFVQCWQVALLLYGFPFLTYKMMSLPSVKGRSCGLDLGHTCGNFEGSIQISFEDMNLLKSCTECYTRIIYNNIKRVCFCLEIDQ